MKSKLNPTRRALLAGTATLPLVACTQADRTAFMSDDITASGQFMHGIASGDPLARSVILWTRVTPDKLDNPTVGDVAVEWEISRDENFADLAGTGLFTTNAARDYTVKVEAQDLLPGTTYYYRFRAGETVSAVGRTRTLPVGATPQMRLAIASCANWQHGYFNVYDLIAKTSQDNPFDLLVHLGDYYYEYAALETAQVEGRLHEPAHEIVALPDYRQRHAQYRSDGALQSVTATIPMITVWDDHETSNDSWKTGAENHQPDTEGLWDDRKQAALRAYYEWMPVRQPAAGRAREAFYRTFDLGDLASLTCVETRLNARTEPLIIEEFIDDITDDAAADAFKRDILNDPSREMFGGEQLDFIVDALSTSKASGKPWRLLANQVIMGKVLTPDFSKVASESVIARVEPDWAGVRDFLTLSKYEMPMYPDSWDGYPAARERFYSALCDAGVNDMLVLTGDAHEFWVNDLRADDGEKVGLELVTSSVSSNTLSAYMGGVTSQHNMLVTRKNKDSRFYNAEHSGFIDLTLTPQSATVVMRAVDTVASRDYSAFEVVRFTVTPDDASISARKPKGLGLLRRLLF